MTNHLNYSVKPKTQYKYYTLLACMYVTIMVASTTVAYKPVQIGPFTATASSLLFACTFAISSIIAEVYGRKTSKTLIWIVIPCGLLFTILITGLSHLPSPADWNKQAAFNYVLGSSMRFAAFGTVGSIISYHINIYLITKWKFLTSGKYFTLRTIGANSFGEFFLVAITTFGAFSGVYPTREVISIFAFAYISKIFFSFILAWPSALIATITKKRERLDVYDAA